MSDDAAFDDLLRSQLGGPAGLTADAAAAGQLDALMGRFEAARRRRVRARWTDPAGRPWPCGRRRPDGTHHARHRADHGASGRSDDDPAAPAASCPRARRERRPVHRSRRLAVRWILVRWILLRWILGWFVLLGFVVGRTVGWMGRLGWFGWRRFRRFGVRRLERVRQRLRRLGVRQRVRRLERVRQRLRRLGVRQRVRRLGTGPGTRSGRLRGRLSRRPVGATPRKSGSDPNLPQRCGVSSPFEPGTSRSVTGRVPGEVGATWTIDGTTRCRISRPAGGPDGCSSGPGWAPWPRWRSPACWSAG